MKKPNKAFWRADVINGHQGSVLVFNYPGEHGHHVLAQVWPADEKGRHFMCLFDREAHNIAPTKRTAQAWARRDLKRLREKLEAL